MGKAKANSKAKSGTGKGTDKKGWNRWQAGANKKNVKPYKSKGVKHPEGSKLASNNNGDTRELTK